MEVKLYKNITKLNCFLFKKIFKFISLRSRKGLTLEQFLKGEYLNAQRELHA